MLQLQLLAVDVRERSDIPWRWNANSILQDDQAGSVVWHSQHMYNSTAIDALHPVLLAKLLWRAFGDWRKGL